MFTLLFPLIQTICTVHSTPHFPIDSILDIGECLEDKRTEYWNCHCC